MDARLPPSSADVRSPYWWAGFAAVLATAVLSHLEALSGGFVWDDHFLGSGEIIGGAKTLGEAVTRPFIYVYYRPLTSAWLFIERALWGPRPAPYHAVGLLLFALTVAIVMFLLRALIRSEPAALAGGLFFAVQPIQAAPAAWIGGRTDALCNLFAALSLLALVTAARSERRAAAGLGAAALCYALAVFSKEQALALLPAGPLAVVWLSDQPFAVKRARAWAALGLFTMVAVAYALLAHRLHIQPEPSGEAPSELAANLGRSGLYYAQCLLAPTPRPLFTFSLAHLRSAGPWTVVAGFLLLGAASLTLLRLARSSREAAWLLAVTLFLLAPALNLAPIQVLLKLAPYRAALAGIGVAGLLGWAAARSAARAPAAWVGVGVVAAWWLGMTLWSTGVWASDLRFQGTVVRFDPGNLRARYNYASALDLANRPAEAAAELAAILDGVYGSHAWSDPQQAVALVNRDNRVLDAAASVQYFEQPTRHFLAELFANLADMRWRCHDTEGAARAYLSGVAISPDDQRARRQIP